MADERTHAEPEWSEAVVQAAEHAATHDAAAEAAPPPRDAGIGGLVLGVSLVALAAVLVWDFYALSRPPEPPPLAEEATDLRWFVADAVDLIEDFRLGKGRLPTRADLGDVLPRGVAYMVRAETYSVTFAGLGTQVVYDESVPIERWLVSDTIRGPP